MPVELDSFTVGQYLESLTVGQVVKLNFVELTDMEKHYLKFQIELSCFDFSEEAGSHFVIVSIQKNGPEGEKSYIVLAKAFELKYRQVFFCNYIKLNGEVYEKNKTKYNFIPYSNLFLEVYIDEDIDLKIETLDTVNPKPNVELYYYVPKSLVFHRNY